MAGPHQFAFARSLAQSPREQDAFVEEKFDGSGCAAQALEGGEHHAECGLHLGVRVKCEGAIGQVDQAHGRPHLELAAARLIELTAAHASLEEVQLRLAHSALEPEEQSIVEAGRVVDAVLIEDEGAGQGTQFKKPVPVGGVAGQARDLQPHDDAGLGERYFADQFLEAVAGNGAGSRFAQIAVDNVDPFGRPTGGNGAIPQPILSLRALAVLGDLSKRRLTDVEVGVASEVIGGDFELRHMLAPRLA